MTLSLKEKILFWLNVLAIVSYQFPFYYQHLTFGDIWRAWKELNEEGNL
jgi:hypothetical protein